MAAPAHIERNLIVQTGRPRVLVLLAAFNGAQWIKQQIQSILDQEEVAVRLVIRDDGSKDQTRSEIARFACDDRVRLTDNNQSSGSAAQNFLSLIRDNAGTDFDFIALADQDDLWDRAKLTIACRRLVADRSAGYSSATLASWEDGRSLTLAPSGFQNASDFLFEGAGQGCTFVMTSIFYERVRRFLLDHRTHTKALHYHDWAIYALARAWGLSWTFDTTPSVIYRQHATNDTGARGSVRGALKRLMLIRRGWYRTQLGAICDICHLAAPTNATVAAWHALFYRSHGWRRKVKLTRFCIRGGRRRARDNLVLILASLAGWI